MATKQYFKGIKSSTTVTSLGDSLNSVTSGTANVAVGNNTLNAITTQNSNTGVGDNVMNNTISSLNTAVGKSSFTSLTTGTRNSTLGSNSGAGLVSEDYNTLVGADTSVDAAGRTGCVVLGNSGTTSANNQLTISLNNGGSLLRTSFTTVAGGTLSNTSTFPMYLELDALGIVATPTYIQILTTQPRLEYLTGDVTISSPSTGQVLRYNGTVWTNSSSGTVPSTATTGDTLYWNGTSWVASANIFNNNGNVGIGNSGPGTKLDVTGAITSSLDSIFHSITVGRGAGSISSNTAVGNGVLAANTTATSNTAMGNGSGALLTTGSNNTLYGASSTTAANNTSGCTIIGKSAVNTANNQLVISTNNNSNLLRTPLTSVAASSLAGTNTTPAVFWQFDSFTSLTGPIYVPIFTEKPRLDSFLSGDVTITSPSTGQVLRYNGTIWVNSSLGTVPSTATSGDTLYWNGTSWVASANIFNNNGNVGIGNSGPGTKLDVTGAITASLDSIFNSITVGRGAGSISSNTTVGNGSLAANTTGASNTAVGNASGALLTTGSNNTLYGASSTTAANNTAGCTIIGKSAVNTADNQLVISTNNNANLIRTPLTSVAASSLAGTNTTPAVFWQFDSFTSLTGPIYVPVFKEKPRLDSFLSGDVTITTPTTGNVLRYNGTIWVNSSLGTVPSTATTGDTLYWNGTSWVASANIFNNNGNVGIGNSGPGTKLDVTGAITSSLDSIFNSVTVGRGAGSIATNTTVGNGSLAANTSGASNTAMGNGSGALLTTGSNNTLYGASSTTAANNTAGCTIIGKSAVNTADNQLVISTNNNSNLIRTPLTSVAASSLAGTNTTPAVFWQFDSFTSLTGPIYVPVFKEKPRLDSFLSGDVSISSPATGQNLRYNGTNWVNNTRAFITFEYYNATAQTGNAVVINTSASWTLFSAAFTTLTGSATVGATPVDFSTTAGNMNTAILQYTGTLTKTFQVTFSLSAGASTANRTHFAALIKGNTPTLANRISGVGAGTASGSGRFVGIVCTATVSLATNDTVQVILSRDNVGSLVLQSYSMTAVEI